MLVKSDTSCEDLASPVVTPSSSILKASGFFWGVGGILDVNYLEPEALTTKQTSLGWGRLVLEERALEKYLKGYDQITLNPKP